MEALTEAEAAIADRFHECPPPIMEQTEMQAIGRTSDGLIKAQVSSPRQ
jgi:hypothetical protein